MTTWFAPARVPVMSQVTGLLGQFGQLTAAYPLVALLRAAGWTASFLIAGVAGLAVAGLVLAFVRDRPPGTRLGFWTHFTTQFPATVFALIWGYPFLVVGAGRSPGEAGLLIGLLVLVGMVVGPVTCDMTGTRAGANQVVTSRRTP